MNTAILGIALATALSAPSWQTSYVQAQETAVAQRKPLAIVFGSGAGGWSKVISDPTPTPEVGKLLADHYVCVYVDTTTADGKQFAKNFDITGNTGVVISDRTGSLQAFWHQGDLTSKSMVSYLQKYSDPRTMVTGTETVNSARVSYYQNQAPAMRSVNC